MALKPTVIGIDILSLILIEGLSPTTIYWWVNIFSLLSFFVNAICPFISVMKFKLVKSFSL